MSILIIRNDDDCEEVYNRTTVFCYTKMPKNKLWDYVWKLELLTEDRQAFFFKVDLDIFAAPATMPELSEWCILSVILKSLKRPFSFGILVKLFLENFPYRLLVDFSDTSIFICSGALNGGKVLSGEDHLAFQQLSTHHKKTFQNSIKVSERYKKLVTSSEEAPSVICQLAQDYNIRGGHWLMFFNRLDISKRELVFDILFKAALNNWGLITRFNAKISADSFIVCFGNNSTISITDPSFLVSDQLKSEEVDPVPKMVREIIDKIYDVHSAVFGFFGAKYKPDIISACCIQRDNFIRPTVYQANYGFYYENFQPLPAANPNANPASTKAKSSTIGSEVRQLNGMHDYEL